jgi:protein-tyrosine phosphatase
LLRRLEEVRAVLRSGGRAEVFCYGGHGRTGTVLACLAVLDGEPPDAAIARLRRDYCSRAVSTSELADFVRVVASDHAR